ncbi:hypothetical protein Tco_0551545 [Tanacetum coccineum]
MEYFGRGQYANIKTEWANNPYLDINRTFGRDYEASNTGCTQENQEHKGDPIPEPLNWKFRRFKMMKYSFDDDEEMGHNNTERMKEMKKKIKLKDQLKQKDGESGTGGRGYVGSLEMSRYLDGVVFGRGDERGVVCVRDAREVHCGVFPSASSAGSKRRCGIWSRRYEQSLRTITERMDDEYILCRDNDIDSILLQVRQVGQWDCATQCSVTGVQRVARCLIETINLSHDDRGVYINTETVDGRYLHGWERVHERDEWKIIVNITHRNQTGEVVDLEAGGKVWMRGSRSVDMDMRYGDSHIF